MTDKSSNKILKFLQKWDSEYHTYNLMTFHNMEIYGELEKHTYLKDWWDIDLTKHFDDEFLAFSTEGGTGYLALWKSPNLKKTDLPVVRLSSYREDPELSASNLNDLVNRMLHNIYFNGDWDGEQRNKEELEEIYYDLINEYESEFEKEISLEDIGILLEEDRAEFKKRALKIISFVSEDQIEENIKKLPSIVERNIEFDDKNNELLPDDHINKKPNDFVLTIELLPKVLEGFDILSKDDENASTIKQAIKELKTKYPDLYNSKLFEEWMLNSAKSNKS